MSKHRPLRSYISEVVTGTDKEEFLTNTPDPVLVQAYRASTAAPTVNGDQTLISPYSGSAIINPDDVDVHCIGSYGTHEFAGSLIIAGRDATLDIVIAEGPVSRRHARFARQRDGTTLVYDMSTNGTLVDDRRIPKDTPTTLENGQKISFSPEVTFEFYTPEGFWHYLQLRAQLEARKYLDAS